MPEFSERFFRSGTLRIHFRDFYLEPDDLQRRLASFRDARFLEIAGAGHMVHFDRPRELVTAIRRFLLDAGAAPAPTVAR